MIYVDALLPCLPNGRWKWCESCHLFCDVGELAALHSFALKLGLKRSWFQPHAGLPHYDLTAGKRFQALRIGAVEVTREIVVEKIGDWRTHRAQAPVQSSLFADLHNSLTSPSDDSKKETL